MIEATYSPEDNKIRLRNTERFTPEDFARATAAGFRWAPKQELLVAPAWSPAREDVALSLATDHTIEPEESSAAERAEQRAERFSHYAERRAADATQAADRFHQIADNIPLGQPILMGHHSERRARKDRERIQRAADKAASDWKTSKYWQERAADLLKHAERMDSPGVRARRIKTLEAEARKIERRIDDAQTTAAAWQSLLAAIHQGAPSGWSRTNKATSEKTTLSYQEAAERLADYDQLHTSTCYTLSAYPETPEEMERRAQGIGRPTRYEGAQSVYSALRERIISPQQAASNTLAACWAILAAAVRWREHLANRIVYERAVLEAQGHKPLPTAAEKRAARPSLPPIVNTRHPLALLNRYDRRSQEAVTLPVVTMTAAEYARIPTDMKACDTTPPDADGVQWRARVAVARTAGGRPGGGLVQVFLSDKPETAIAGHQPLTDEDQQAASG